MKGNMQTIEVLASEIQTLEEVKNDYVYIVDSNI